MAEPLDSINTVFGKLSEFLNVFDLSFFISGATCLGAVAFWVYHKFGNFFSELKGILGFAVATIAAYVLGLICFSIGRWIRRHFHQRETTKLWPILENHGLGKSEPFKSYLLIKKESTANQLIITPEQYENEQKKANEAAEADKRREESLADCLYTRLWAEIRQSPELQPSLNHLNRYWIMAATYDGLAVAIFAWILAFADLGSCAEDTFALKAITVWIICILLFSLILICFREAKRLDDYQMDELAATMAYMCQKGEQS